MTTVRDTKSMEQRLAEIGRRIDSLMDKAGDVGGVRGALAKELDVWRRWRDELHLKAELAGMDARDALEATLEKVEVAFGRAHELMDELVAGVDFDADEVGALVAKEMSGLRRELESAGADFKIV